MDKSLQNLETPYLSTDYLLELFKDYDYPKDKIKNLTKAQDLINVVRGIYVTGVDYKKAYSKEVLANLIYGPSVISFEYALSYHGLIPERVEVITSLCFKRNKIFQTPVGNFSYKYISSDKYPVGIHYEQTSLGNFFIATPEKAICDLAFFQKINSEEVAIEYLIDDLRINQDRLMDLKIEKLLELKKVYARSNVGHVVDAIIFFQQGNNHE
jgi:hypothetical protein